MSVESRAPALGILFMLVGMFSISINDVLIKSLAGAYPLHELVLIRSLVGVVISAVILQLEGGVSLLKTAQPGLHALRALLVVFANSAFFAAIVAMPLATATAIYFVAPLIVTLLSIPVLGERVGARRFAAVGLGFVGVMVMLLPQISGGTGAGWAAILPVLAAAGYAGMAVLTRKLGQASRASALAIYLQSAFLLVGLTVYLLAGDGRYFSPDLPPSLQFLLRPWIWPERADLPALAGLGLMSAAIGYCLSQAYRMAAASVVAPFEYVLMVFALIWGWVIFGEWPGPSVFVGAGIIVVSGVYIFLRESRVGRGG